MAFARVIYTYLYTFIVIYLSLQYLVNNEFPFAFSNNSLHNELMSHRFKRDSANAISEGVAGDRERDRGKQRTINPSANL